jgi:ATP-dependent RNA helicase DeaD
MENFLDANLIAPLQQALDKMGYVKPTPIQSQSIPIALEGKDILASAQTGTGKTAAFLIPLISSLVENPHNSAIILSPTRELTKQIADVAKEMLQFMPQVKSCSIVGGEHMGKQLQALKKKPQLIIGTPGRVIDHLERGSLRLAKTKHLVLDETDRMLDMGFDEQIADIVQDLPAERQTLLFSATISKQIARIAQQYLTTPERIAIGHSNEAAAKIKQEKVETSSAGKYSALTDALGSVRGAVIVFVKTQINTDKLAYKLLKDKYEVVALHGGLPQRKRDRAIKSFRNQRVDILVATDVAARGLDIDNVALVVNYDLPQAPEDYVHRIGRTGRAGNEGHAVSLVTPADNAMWFRIDKFLNPDKYQGRASRNNDGASNRRGSNGKSKSRSNTYTRSNRNNGAAVSAGRRNNRDNSDNRRSSSDGDNNQGNRRNYSNGGDSNQGNRSRYSNGDNNQGNRRSNSNVDNNSQANRRSSSDGGNNQGNRSSYSNGDNNQGNRRSNSDGGNSQGNRRSYSTDANNNSRYKASGVGESQANTRSNRDNRSDNSGNSSYQASSNGASRDNGADNHHHRAKHGSRDEHAGISTGNKSFNSSHRGKKAQDHARGLLDKKFRKQTSDGKKIFSQETQPQETQQAKETQQT